MKLHLLNRSSSSNRSLTVSHNCYANFLRVWHFHPEFELVLILQSSGMRFVGDHIDTFNVGDIVLIGKNVPHMWLNEDRYFEEHTALKAEAISIHFEKDFLGKDFFEVPEMHAILQLLDKAQRGIRFLEVKNEVVEKLSSLVHLHPTAQIIKVLEILFLLANHKAYELLASNSFVNSFQKTENRRLDKIYEYVFENFNNPISSSDIANVVGMNSSAFSRFFKKIHRKPFTRYLNEIRIGYACKLLIENKESITAIAYLSGFNNISNFNRQFKIIKGTSPSQYLEYHNEL